MSGTDWSPIHHEHIAEEPKAEPAGKNGAKNGRDARPASDMGMALGLALNLQPAALDRITEISEAQTEIIDRLELSNDSLQEVAAAMLAAHATFGEGLTAIAQGQQDLMATMAAQADEAQGRADEAKAMFEASRTQSEALMAFLANTTKLIGQVEKAIIAPRKVTLNRDANGLANEAISRVAKP